MHFHIDSVLAHDLGNALHGAKSVDIPVLFMNGDWDEYTTVEDARLFGNYVRNAHFATIRSAGHFLDMEHKSACQDSRDVLLDFLKPSAKESRVRYQHIQGHHALAI
ncbi:Rhamnosyltransferase 1 subunit A [compost metagenome]